MSQYPLDTALLNTFVVLCETKSFTLTAERVHRSQSAVTMQISKLEKLLGCQLFKRTKRHVELTEKGYELLPMANHLLDKTQQLFTHFRHDDLRGDISFGSPEDFATYYLPEVLSRFTEHHPHVHLRVNCELTKALIDAFEQRKYDIVVIKQLPTDIYPSAKPLWTERLVWVCSKQRYEHLSQAESVFANERVIPLVLSPERCVYRARALQALEKQGVMYNISYTSPSIAGVIAAVRAGLGFAVLPRKFVPNDLMPLEHHGLPRLEDAEICLLFHEDASDAVHSLAQYIEQHLHFNHKN